MFELIVTGLGVGISNFISCMMINNESFGSYKFNLGSTNTKIDYNVKLNPDRRNLHVTIDLDFNF